MCIRDRALGQHERATKDYDKATELASNKTEASGNRQGDVGANESLSKDGYIGNMRV